MLFLELLTFRLFVFVMLLVAAAEAIVDCVHHAIYVMRWDLLWGIAASRVRVRGASLGYWCQMRRGRRSRYLQA